MRVYILHGYNDLPYHFFFVYNLFIFTMSHPAIKISYQRVYLQDAISRSVLYNLMDSSTIRRVISD